MKRRIYKLLAMAIVLIVLSGEVTAAAILVPVLKFVGQLLACSALGLAQKSATTLILYQLMDNVVINSIKEMLQTDSLRNIILFPEPSIIAEPVIVNLVEFFTHLMIPFYTLVISATAFYLIFASGSIVGRARAKATLIKLVIAIVVTIFAIPIMQLLLDISRTVSHIVMGFADIGLAGQLMIATSTAFSDYLLWLFMASYWSGFPLFMIFATLSVGMFVLLTLRFYMIILWTVLFPFTVVMYSFHLTRRMGVAMMEQTFQWIFMQVLVSFLLISIAVGVESIPDHFIGNSYFRMSLGMIAFSLFTILPFMTMGIMDMMAIVTMFGGIEVSTSGLITIVDEMTIEDVGTTEITPPSPVKPF